MAEDGDRTPQSWLRYSHLGVQFAVTMLAFVLLGTWADSKWAIGPWGTIAGSLVGIFSAMYLLIRQVGR